MWMQQKPRWQAIINGIHYITKNIKDVTGILICSDCKPAINILSIRNNKPETKAKYRAETRLYDELTHRVRWIRFRHVGAHGDGTTTPSYINNLVDAAIKDAYRRHLGQGGTGR